MKSFLNKDLLNYCLNTKYEHKFVYVLNAYFLELKLLNDTLRRFLPSFSLRNVMETDLILYIIFYRRTN